MSESKYREWILDTIDSLRSRKARPDLERICRMVRRRHGSEPDRTCAELEKLIQEQTVLKVNYKGSISYRNAAKVQRRSRKNRDDGSSGGVTASGGRSRSVLLEEGASHSDLSNGDSALGPADQDQDQDDTEDLEADGSMAMDTDSNGEEETADERSQDGRGGGRPPGHKSTTTTYEDGTVKCAPVHAFSAPCSPSGSRPGPSSSISPSPTTPGTGLDSVSLAAWKAIGRPSSLPPSSPRALAHNEWAYDSAFCPAERQHPGMQKDKGKGAELAGAVKSAGQPVSTSPCAPKNASLCNAKNTSPMTPKNISPCTPKDISPCTPPKDISPCTPKDTVKKEEGWRTEDRGPSYDQMVPDNNGTKLDETKNVCVGSPQALPLTSDNCVKSKKKLDLDSLIPAEDIFLNGGKNGDISVKKENVSQNLLQWSVADVASYFSTAGFPEQAVAFRTQEIDGKSLLLMQRSDVLTGMSIRLGPALKIYERHVKVLQRTHFLEDEDL